MKISIYKFWVGSSKKRTEIENQINQLNKKLKHFEIILAPNKNEHQFLYENNKMYKMMFDNKKIDELENIYKFWIGSKKTNFIYINYAIEFDEKELYELFLDCQKHQKNCFIFCSRKTVYSGFYININASHIMHDSYVFYCNNNNINANVVLTKHLQKFKFVKNWKNYNDSFAYFYDINFLNFDSSNFGTLKLNPEKYANKKEGLKYWTKKNKLFRFVNFTELLYYKLPLFLQNSLAKMIT